MRRFHVLMVAVLIASAGTPSVADERRSELTDASPEVTWSGRLRLETGYIVGTATCAHVSHPGCDLYTLDVDAPAGRWVAVAPRLQRTSPSQAISFDVLDATGVLVGQGHDDNRGFKPAIFRHGPGRAPYTVRVSLRIGHLTATELEYRGQAALTRTPMDVEESCTSDFLPDRVEGPAGTEGTDRLHASVLVLLDGVDDGYASEVMAGAASTFDTAEIDLDVDYRRVAFDTADPVDSGPLFSLARAEVGGYVPEGYDAVYILTTKDLSEGPSGRAVAGRALCVEGARSPMTAFAVGEKGRDTFYGAIIAAHEIAHLFGAHHHYTTCGHGHQNVLRGRPLSVCSVMSPDIALGSLNMGPVEASVVRGHLSHAH
ncbi:MAG TPA: zinc-dependent metalloprotease family protein [Actinomycetota bacterium]|nr:zinc-dependent metalloprotease family protein [Actinomycetota bacterium]